MQSRTLPEMRVLQGGGKIGVTGRYLEVRHRSGKKWLISHNIAL
jgi:hypothetical protein